jgi:hypothetical protein
MGRENFSDRMDEDASTRVNSALSWLFLREQPADIKNFPVPSPGFNVTFYSQTTLVTSIVRPAKERMY